MRSRVAAKGSPKTAAAETTKREQAVKWVVVAALSVLVFGGLYMAVKILE